MLWYTIYMKCYVCGNETNKTNGSSRGKPIYVCECGKKFTREKPPYNEIDRWLAYDLRVCSVRFVAKLLGCSIGTAYNWKSVTNTPEKPNDNKITEHVKRLPHGKEIAEIFGVVIY